MEWIEINKDELPSREVLAANFKPETYGYKEKLVGYIGLDENGILCCESDRELLENVTHFIDISKFDIESHESGV
jgi:hypothetical protein